MRRLAIVAAVLLAAAGITAPAHAGWPGGNVQHAADDSGYNPPVWIGCDNNQSYSLGLGQSSRNVCGDVNVVYVGPGDQLRCRNSGNGSWVTYDATGWHSIGNFTVMVCYQQKD